MNEETFYKIKLDLVHNTINNFVHVMQYDDGVAYIRAEIYKDWQHVYPSEEFDSAELRLKKHDGAWIKCNSVEPYIPVAKPSYEKAKTDGVYYYYQNGNYILVTSSVTEQAYDALDPNLFYKNVGTIISLEHDYVKINVVEELTDIPGGCPAVIDLYSTDGHIQTAKFVLDVDRNPIQTGETVKNVPEDISAKLSEMAKGIANTVKVTPQTLTDEEKVQARENIGVGSSDLNIENGSGVGSVQQTQDGNSGVFDFTNKNPNATALDNTLTGNIPYGATGNFAISLGGKGQASGKRAFQVGTTTIAKGDYSFSSGDNSVALADDSFAGNYKTVSAGIASFSIGYETQAIGPVSFVSGTRNKVDGGNAAGFGNDNVISHNNQFVIGYFNNNKIGTLFEIGNGTNDSNRSNAFEVYSDGHAEVQTQGTTDKSVAQVKFVKDELDSYLPQIRLSSSQVTRPMSRVVHDTYTEHKITFQLTSEQAGHIEDNSKPTIKLQLSQHIPYIDGDYLYLQRNVIQTLAEREVIQFTFNNARFNFDEALTQGYVPMTEIGDGAAIYDKSTKTLFVSFVETSPKKVEDALNINLENGSAYDSLKQIDLPYTELVDAIVAGSSYSRAEVIVALASYGITSDTHNYIYGAGSTTFGIENTTGVQGDNSKGLASFNSGIGNKITGNGCSGNLGGTKNENGGSLSVIAGGTENTIGNENGRNGIIGGEYNELDANDAFIGGGIYNEIWEKASAIVGGQHNQIGDAEDASVKARYSVIAGGHTNKIINDASQNDADFAFVGGGQGNIVQHRNAATLGGYGLKTGRANQALAGQFNEVVSDALFAVGNGTSDSNRSNALVVSVDGSATVGGTNNNIDANTVKRSVIAGGYTNKIQATNALLGDLNGFIGGGQGNIINEYKNVGMLGGSGLRARWGNQSLVGAYNELSKALFIVGDGTGDAARKNAFEVLGHDVLGAGNVGIKVGNTQLTENKLQEIINGGGGTAKLYKQTVLIAPSFTDVPCVIYTHKATALTDDEVFGSVANYVKNVVKIFYYIKATDYESFYYEGQMYFDEGGNNRSLYPCNYNGSQTQPSYSWQDWMGMTVVSIEEV